MTQDRIDVIQRALAATTTRDMEAIERLVSDELEFRSTFAASEGRTFSGPSAIRDYFAAVDEAFDDVEITLERVIASEGERVLVEARVRGRGRGSGIEVDHLYGQIYTVRDGLIVHIDSYTDPDEAAAAFSGAG